MEVEGVGLMAGPFYLSLGYFQLTTVVVPVEGKGSHVKLDGVELATGEVAEQIARERGVEFFSTPPTSRRTRPFLSRVLSNEPPDSSSSKEPLQ